MPSLNGPAQLHPPSPRRWVFVYEKGYQTSSSLISSVSVKLKGLAVTQLPGLGPQVWDVADYVFPAQVSWLRARWGSVPPPCGPVQLLSLSGPQFPHCE